MAALAKRLVEIQRAKAPGKQVHLQLLEAFAEHGQQATCLDAANLVASLRKARDEVVTRTPPVGMSQRQQLQLWAGQCTGHEAWQLLRDRMFRDGKDGVEGLSSTLLSRTYNNFRHMSLTREADEVWPLVASRVEDGSMKDAHQLLGVWNVAPEEHLPHLDAPLEKAMGADQERVWREMQLLSCIARAPDQPGSKAVLWCARELGRRLVDLTSEDIASLVVHLDARLRGADGVPGDLRDLARKAQDELVARDGTLEPRHLVGLLGSIDSRDDKLWTLLRRELLAAKVSVPQVLEVCRFLHRLPGGRESEPSLYGKMAKQLRSTLATKAEPGLVTRVARNLECFVGDFDTCQSLLNAAVRLRKDLFPGALWTLFTCMSEVDLVGRHPSLQNRLRMIGDVLEQHGIQQKTTLKEMAGIGEAMRRNKTPLAKCSSKMAERFLEVLQTAEDEYRQRDSPGDVAEESKTGTRAESAEGVGSTNYLAVTQQLLVGFWAELRGLGIEEPALTEAARRVCSAAVDGCGRQLDAPALAECIQKLEAVASKDAEAAELRDGLVALLVERFPRLSQRALVEAADLGASDALRTAVNAEVGRRLLGSSGHATAGTVAGISALRRGEDLDDLVAILSRWAAWSSSSGLPLAGAAVGSVVSGGAAGSLPPTKLVSHTELLVATSLPGIMRREPVAAARRLSATVQAFLAGGPGNATPLVPLQQGLHLLSSPSSVAGSGLSAAEPQQNSTSSSSVPEAAPATLGLPTAADLAFGFCALSGGPLPLDVAARLCRLTGGALVVSGSSDSDGAEAAEAAIGAGRAAELWAYGLSMRHLISPSARATLRMMPEASILEACLAHFERRPQRARFALAQDSDVAATLARLRAGLADAIPAGEAIEERFAVPASPYIADIALPGRGMLLVVPRKAHRAPGGVDDPAGSGDGLRRGALGGRGRLLEAVVESMGWQLRWMWPEEWGSEASEEPVDPQVLKVFLGIGSNETSTSQDAA